MRSVRRVWGNESGSFWVRRAALGEAARLPFERLMRADEEEAGRRVEAGEREAYLAEIARALAEIVSELKEVNTSLRAIARSQAQQATQKRPQPGS
jgi:hypothetical protein